MKGPGRLYVFAAGQPAPLAAIATPDALHDVAWSEQAPTAVAGACASGAVLLFDLAAGRAHTWPRVAAREVASVDWSPVAPDTLVAAAYDGSLTALDPARGPVLQLAVGACAHEATCHPRDAATVAVAAADAAVRTYDLRQPARPALLLPQAHQGEVLCLDWNKYDAAQLATGSVDQTVRVWDLRHPASPLATLAGHYRAVRRVKFSPFHRSQLASAGYDMTVRIWNTDSLNPVAGPAYTEHTEFVLGLAYSLQQPGLLATCSWDESVHLLDTAPAPLPLA